MTQAAFSCERFGPCRVTRLRGREAMGTLSRIDVDVVAASADHDLEALVDASAVVGLFDGGGGTRNIALIVVAARYAGLTTDGHRYRFELAPRVHSLTLRSGFRVWQKKTTQEIVQGTLDDLGVGAEEVSWRLTGQYGKRTQCVQYAESEWDFVSRLLCDEGINVWFDRSDDDTPVVVFGDTTGSHASIIGDHHIRFEDPSNLERNTTSIHSLTYAVEMSGDRVHVRDYDIKQPDLLIEGLAGEGTFEHFEFPANVLNEQQAKARAKVRLEQLQRTHIEVVAESRNVRLQPGRVIQIEGACDELFHGAFLITSVEHHVAEASRAGTTVEPYHNRVVLVPFVEGRPFRPALPAASPRVDGLETAVVTGATGEEITVGELGEIHARFRWDRSGIEDDKSSRKIRCLQLNMSGSMILPRIGWEVPLAYVNGSPDLPFALGRLYNSSSPLPYGQPGKSATSTLQSATSPADGTTQEIRTSDDSGSMEMFIHASKDQTIAVGGDQTVTVDVDETHDVKKSAALKVDGGQTATIGGNQSVIVGADATITVDGARSETIGGMEEIGVTGTYNLAIAGAYQEGIGGVYGIQCNQSNTVIQGSFTQLVGGAMVQVAGLGTNQSCASARMEKVSGPRTIIAKFSVADSVVGVKKVTAGSTTETAAADIVTNVGGVGLIKVGGSAKLSASGPIAFEAPRIKLKAGGSITAKGGPALEISGKVEAAGKTKFDASTTHKKSTSKVG